MPPDPDIVRNRGVAYANLGRHEEALTAYAEAEQLRKEQGLPPDPDIVRSRGSAYANLGRYEDELQAYAEAEQLRK